jgi:hypothetical protein
MTTWIEIYAWSMAVIYPAVNIAILIACLYATRHPAFRRDFGFLAAAAALSIFCSVVMLLLRLHQSFHFAFLTPSVRRGLLLPHDLAEIASIIFYCIGIFTLAFHVRSLSNSTHVA